MWVLCLLLLAVAAGCLGGPGKSPSPAAGQADDHPGRDDGAVAEDRALEQRDALLEHRDRKAVQEVTPPGRSGSSDEGQDPTDASGPAGSSASTGQGTPGGAPGETAGPPADQGNDHQDRSSGGANGPGGSDDNGPPDDGSGDDGDQEDPGTGARADDTPRKLADTANDTLESAWTGTRP